MQPEERITVSMCIDGVTPPAGRKHNHVFVLTDPSQESFPRFHSIQETSSSGVDSAKVIIDETMKLFERGVRIHCFVTDGGSGYVSVFHPNTEARKGLLLQPLSEICGFVPLHFQCWAHKLNTALRHIHSRSILLRGALNLLSSFAETISISKSELPNPPKFIGSRWISCGPIVQWYRTNRQTISTLIALTDSELHFLDLLHDLIHPLFNTVGVLERNSMSIANSPPLLTNLVYLLCSLAQSVHPVSFQWANLINDVATEVCRLTLLDDDGFVAILGYSLTSEGREAIRQKTFLRDVENQKSPWKGPSQPQLWDELFINHLQKKVARTRCDREEFDGDIVSDDDDEDTIAIHSIVKARERKRVSWRTSLDELSAKRRSDDDELILLIQPGESVSKGVEIVVEIDQVLRFTRPLASSFIQQLTPANTMVGNLEILLERTFPNMKQSEMDRNLSTYEVWLDGGVVPNQHRLMNSSVDFWKKEVESEESEFHQLAFLADTLLRTPPTQASAERTIKVVKRHASLKRPRLLSKTNDAILRVASLSESNLWMRFDSMRDIRDLGREASQLPMVPASSTPSFFSSQTLTYLTTSFRCFTIPILIVSIPIRFLSIPILILSIPILILLVQILILLVPILILSIPIRFHPIPILILSIPILILSIPILILLVQILILLIPILILSIPILILSIPILILLVPILILLIPILILSIPILILLVPILILTIPILILLVPILILSVPILILLIPILILLIPILILLILISSIHFLLIFILFLIAPTSFLLRFSRTDKVVVFTKWGRCLKAGTCKRVRNGQGEW
ncbi:hypothetical protein BLNAU_20608 [Blattamonas nauphoetae]|uniref:Uncharacterized protein n=1 Tax=Blattamonas nauphoetae TaxID=2049346 RepID=A0ABQ9WYB1_9EUKA|nr:hypothetical protein BLNAU_20608 [Blattamonas nauphoetae]